MGTAASVGLSTALETATPRDVEEWVIGVAVEDRARLQTMLQSEEEDEVHVFRTIILTWADRSEVSVVGF